MIPRTKPVELYSSIDKSWSFGPHRLIAISLLLLSSALFAQDKNLRFKHYTPDDGLSQSTILCVEQDTRGFLWFGTYTGLNRFDGYEFKTFMPDPADSSSLSHPFVGSIHEDHNGILWVGTDNGLNIYNVSKEIFIHLKHDPADNKSLSHNMVRAIFEDSHHRLWIGTRGGGLNLYDPETGGFTHYRYDPDNPKSISHNTISEIIEDPRGYLWIATDGGLNRFDFETESFTRFTHDPLDPGSVSLNNVYRLYLEEDGELWVGTWLGGLNRLNPETGIFKRYDLSRGNSNQANANIIRAIGKDSHGELWVGTWGSGLFQYQANDDQFIAHLHDPSNPESITSNQITSIYTDRSDVLWVGTDFGGLNKRILDSDKFEHRQSSPTSLEDTNYENVHALLVESNNDVWIGTSDGLHRINELEGSYKAYYFDESDPNSISNNSIRSLARDSKGNIWAGTESGLNRYNPESDQFKRYFFSPRITGEEPVDMAWAICEDHEGILWIGSFGGGLIRLDPVSDEFSILVSDNNNAASLQDNFIWSIVEDHENKLWIGTDFNGLSYLDADRQTFIPFNYKTNQGGGLHETKVLSIFEDSSGALWLGTTSGVYSFEQQSKKLSRLSQTDGLSSNIVQGITQDVDGDLWLFTNNGISKLNPVLKTFKNYSVEDGLQGNEFHVNSYSNGPDGYIYMGGVNGYNKFHPDNILDSQYSPEIFLTDLQIFNKPISIGKSASGRSILENSILLTHQLNFKYDENVLSFRFAALDYFAPEKISYAYKMEGFEDNWNFVGSRRFATYTNLDPGNYTFTVKATNSDGIWSDKIREVEINISPPYWRTWWFTSIFTVLLLGLIGSLYLYRIRLLHIRTRLLQNEVEKQTADLTMMNYKLESANGMKELLLDIITHDLRNPIGVIEAMSEFMRKENPDDPGIALIRSSSQNMLRVMENATTLAAVAMGEKIEMAEVNIFHIIDQVINDFSVELKSKQIVVENLLDEDCSIHANPIIEEVFKNYISNAVKYASEGKRLIIGQQVEDQTRSFYVKDFGKTIPEDKRDAIFQRSVQLSEGEKVGRGIGLAIVKRIADAHSAEVGVLENHPQGNIFFFKIQT